MQWFIFNHRNEQSANYEWIHKTDRSIFTNEVINLKYKMVSDDLIWASTKIIIAKGHWPRKNPPIWELFFVLNMAIGRCFCRVNSELISPFFWYFRMIIAKIKLLCHVLFFTVEKIKVRTSSKSTRWIVLFLPIK